MTPDPKAAPAPAMGECPTHEGRMQQRRDATIASLREKIAECAFAVWEAGRLECHGGPPSPIKDPAGNWWAKFPAVKPDTWCAQWKKDPGMVTVRAWPAI